MHKLILYSVSSLRVDSDSVAWFRDWGPEASAERLAAELRRVAEREFLAVVRDAAGMVHPLSVRVEMHLPGSKSVFCRTDMTPSCAVGYAATFNHPTFAQNESAVSEVFEDMRRELFEAMEDMRRLQAANERDRQHDRKRRK